MKTRNSSISGFSLVEVTFALGVVVFCLITILGLLAVGINTTHVSTVQTAATNILTAVTSDLESTPNITPNAPGVAQAKGTKALASQIYAINVPAGGSGTTATQQIFIGENGQVVATAALALYQLNVWITASNTATAKQETFARLLITWPASTTYTSAQGYVENIIAINRT